MRDFDSILLEEKYCIILEDANSTKAQVMNEFLKKELGHNIFKFKNKPENKEKVEEIKNKWTPIIENLADIIIKHNPKDKNLIDLIDLARLYQENLPFEVIENDYKDYVNNPSIKNKNIFKNAKNYHEFAEFVHSETKTKKINQIAGESSDPNKVYEDEKIRVFLVNTGDIKSSEENCKRYGKGTQLCISGSSSSYYYNYYRYEKNLTTYFIWLKEENRYILIDVYEDNNKIKYSYNNVIGNVDVKTDKVDILRKYPDLLDAFNEDVFKIVPIQGEEKYIYERIYKLTSILDTKTDSDAVLYAQINDVKIDDLYMFPINKLEPILEVLVEKPNDLPNDLLSKFPRLKKRYWNKKMQSVERELLEWSEEDDLHFSPDEKIALNEIFKRDGFEKYTNFLKDQTLYFRDTIFIVNTILKSEFFNFEDLPKFLREEILNTPMILTRVVYFLFSEGREIPDDIYQELKKIGGVNFSWLINSMENEIIQYDPTKNEKYKDFFHFLLKKIASDYKSAYGYVITSIKDAVGRNFRYIPDFMYDEILKDPILTKEMLKTFKKYKKEIPKNLLDRLSLNMKNFLNENYNFSFKKFFNNKK
jgi:hypothetical protein